MVVTQGRGCRRSRIGCATHHSLRSRFALMQARDRLVWRRALALVESCLVKVVLFGWNGGVKNLPYVTYRNEMLEHPATARVVQL